MPYDYDIVVIGSGPAGQAVASECRSSGLRLAVVEEREYGGTCPLRGFDPKKVLVGAAEVIARAAGMRGKGIRYQIKDGENGFPVSFLEETAKRIVQLLKNPQLRDRLGKKAKEPVRKRFLLTRYLEQYLDLFRSFETVHRSRGLPREIA